MDVFLEIKSHNVHCLECGAILEADEKDFCHNCSSDFAMNGGVEMFDFAKEFSYGN